MGYRDPKHFFDRELSWLAFNQRVLEEALDTGTPLLERLKFLGITASNLDEFFMVRVSGVQEQAQSNVRITSQAGYSPMQLYALLHKQAKEQMGKMYECLNKEIIPALEEEKISFVEPATLAKKTAKDFRDRFYHEIFPALTPLAVDAGHPFPRVKGLSLNILVELESTTQIRNRGHQTLIATVQVPSNISRVIEVGNNKEFAKFILLEQLIEEHLDMLFPGMTVKSSSVFRVTRDADIEYKEIDAEDLLTHIEEEIRERERGHAVRLELDANASEFHEQFLSSVLGLTPQQVYRIPGPIALNQITWPVLSIPGREQLREPGYSASTRKGFTIPGSIFSKIRKGDILMHHPYESFSPVVDFIREAASDPKVLAIKQTLYRTSGDSPIIRALIEAAENGKQVAALVELKARFDEENNIVWARKLEEAGVHIVYGLVGLKTHCKAAMVVRMENGKIRRYVHLSTGNYNPSTAKIYTDAGLFTCDIDICEDATALFNLLTGYSADPEWQKLIVAPDDLRPSVIKLIQEQAALADCGKPARIRAKMNSLVDTEIIVELYKASKEGVKIDLCVRGVCCLRPGVPGLSENITVYSIVDRFLEHSRCFIFGADDETAKVYLSSADWMDRNMDRRVEVMFPVEDPANKRRVIEEVFGFSALDNSKARYLGSDGVYRKRMLQPGERPFRSQEMLMNLELYGEPISSSRIRGNAEDQLAEQLVAAMTGKTLANGNGKKKSRVGKEETTAIPSERAAQPSGTTEDTCNEEGPVN
ncbi:MAG: polyphosphate kinase 1 [Candidatus Sumerlaeia bacterium]|nr:polyphosphate kinase 1 [Candidatus Sumerlaeia bacterium]